MSKVIENIEPGKEKEPSSFRLIFSLGIAGFFSGLLLVGAYLYSLPLIEANKAEALEKAIFKVLPGCKTFITLELDGPELNERTDSQESQKSSSAEEKPEIFAGYGENGDLVGFAIPASEPGFQDIISAIYGYDATQRIIIGFEVLESKETPGLGDKIFKDADFQTNFTELSVVPELVGVKKGQKVNDNEVETITGATISSKAVIRLLNKSMSQWEEPCRRYLGLKNTEAKELNK